MMGVLSRSGYIIEKKKNSGPWLKITALDSENNK